MAPQQGGHVAVVRTIADLIDDAIERCGMLFEPGAGLHRQIGQCRIQADACLVGDQRDVIVLPQRRQQFGAVVGDAGALRRQRRDVGELCPRRCRFGSLCLGLPLLMQSLKCRDGALRAAIPGKRFGLFQAMPLQFGAIGVI